jgi:uncharacterized protein
VKTDTSGIGSRLLAMGEITVVCAVAYLFGTHHAALTSVALLAIFSYPVLTASFRSCVSWRSGLRTVLIVTAILWAWSYLLFLLLPIVGIDLPDYSLFSEEVESNELVALAVIVRIWTVVAFGEEILARGFLIDRFETIFSGIPKATWLAVLCASILFGIAHRYQGTGGIILSATVAVILSYVYLKQQRTIWTVVIIHGLVDTIAILLLYFGVHLT